MSDYRDKLQTAVYGDVQYPPQHRVALDPLHKDAANKLERQEKRIRELEAENARLRKAAEQDIADARATCGGDGLGCEAFRPYYGDDTERRYRKCGQCPMEALGAMRSALEGRGDE